MNREQKRVFMHAVTASAGQARSVSVSLYPEHHEILALRERELLTGPSFKVQKLLELERQHGVLRRECHGGGGSGPIRR